METILNLKNLNIFLSSKILKNIILLDNNIFSTISDKIEVTYDVSLLLY